jgi:uncharacterized protein (DUF362 family)/Pyruvate/2-oxoacid:ferredoxin oxidoreductase delta subunit
MAFPQQDRTVTVRRCTSYDRALVKEAVMRLGEDSAGGWAKIIPRGSKVLLKPNLLTPATSEQCVSPHPSVVRALVELCRDAGAASVAIGDSPGFGTAQKVAAKCGILDTARELGVEVVDFSDSVTVPAPAGFHNRSFSIAREIVEADVVINLAKLKTHAMMVMTLAVKNMFGAFVGKQKAQWHLQSGRSQDHFARMLVELAYTVSPAMSVLDAIIGMEGNGPNSGTPRMLGFLAASRDMVSLDRVACDITGVAPDTVYIFKAARELGLSVDLEGIRLAGDPIGPLKIMDLKPASMMHVEGPAYFRPVAGLLRRLLTAWPALDASRCKGCGICREACPASAITQPAPGACVRIDDAACIRCYCCQELCPEGAIAPRDAWGLRMLKKLKSN